MKTLAVILLFLTGCISGLIYAIRSFPKREIKRLYNEFIHKEKLQPGEFKHFSEKVDHTLKVIVKPNCETLYSTTFLTDQNGSYTIEIPKVEDYFSIAFLNEQTDVLGYLTNTDLNSEGTTSIQLKFDTLLFKKHEGIIQLKAKICWIIVRYGLDEEGNLNKARALQKQLTLINNAV